MDEIQKTRGKALLIAFLIICIVFAFTLLPTFNEKVKKNSNEERRNEEVKEKEEVDEIDEWQILSANRSSISIEILAFLLIGFGFLMAFIRKYGYTSAISTYLIVSVSIPFYFCIRTLCYSDYALSAVDIKTLILAEFATLAVIIAIGAPLGRINTNQYVLIALLFIPFYAFNEWMLFSGEIIPKGDFLDTAGSVFIHTFGAFFGLGMVLFLTSEKEKKLPITSSKRSNQFAILGSMFLFVFFPALTSALVPLEDIPYTIINTVMALCGAIIATYVFTIIIREKIEVMDIMRATLAGGVAISATCRFAKPGYSILIGMIAGAITVLGVTIIQPRIEKALRIVDTCSVHIVHGFTGIFGGLAALALYWGSSHGPGAQPLGEIEPAYQIAGIILTVVIAFFAGGICGKIVSLLGRKKEPYDDIEEFGEE